MTKIYNTYEEFKSRKDKSINGVSPEFAEKFPNWKEDNETNRGCWNCYDCVRCSNCRDCSNCVSCSNCYDCVRCSNCRDCSNCVSCSNCRDCSKCSNCRDCSNCVSCSNCRDCRDCHTCMDCRRCMSCELCNSCLECEDCTKCTVCEKCKGCIALCGKDNQEGVNPEIPVIHNIHQKVYEAASQPGALAMSDWHTCETTHCRAGWVVHLAGEAGYKLEKAYGPATAAHLIYKASSPIRVSEGSFYVNEEESLESMREAAEAEKKLNENQDLRQL